jgi:hypothetical protein
MPFTMRRIISTGCLVMAALIFATRCSTVERGVLWPFYAFAGCERREAKVERGPVRLMGAYDIGSIANTMRIRQGYTVRTGKGWVVIEQAYVEGKEVEGYVLRFHDAVEDSNLKYLTGHENNDPGTYFNIDGVAPCSMSERTVTAKVRKIIDDLPIRDDQKTELKRHVTVSTHKRDPLAFM